MITIGPMTNLALAIENYPEGVRCMKKVVAMGGVFFNVGNVGPEAEFNVGSDPDAAFEVVRFCRDSCKKTGGWDSQKCGKRDVRGVFSHTACLNWNTGTKNDQEN